MADPATITLAARAAATAATDKRTWTVLLSILIGCAVMLLLPFLLIVSIASGGAESNRQIADIVFDGGPVPSEIPVEFAAHMEAMIENFRQLDDEIEYRNEQLEEGSLDEIRIKAVFFTLYFSSESLHFEDALYEDFIDCFVEETETEDSDQEDEQEKKYTLVEDLEMVYAAVSELTGKPIRDIERQNIENLYLYIKYGYTAASIRPGNIESIWPDGIPPEALNDATFRQLMNEATKYIGLPYVWGGSNPSTSFDCSGFVCWSYTQSGVYNLPRTTAQGIFNQCSVVSKEEVKPGDLVFFTGTYSTSNPVTHIGIYVGENKMLHCGEPIGYADLNNPYWVKHFYAYGRLLK